MISKKKAKEIARNLIQNRMGVIYYFIDEGGEFEKYSEEEKELINECLNKDCERMLKVIGKEYITF